eukprot:662840-Amphidinium_carterae.1
MFSSPCLASPALARSARSAAAVLLRAGPFAVSGMVAGSKSLLQHLQTFCRCLRSHTCPIITAGNCPHLTSAHRQHELGGLAPASKLLGPTEPQRLCKFGLSALSVMLLLASVRMLRILLSASRI